MLSQSPIIAESLAHRCWDWHLRKCRREETFLNHSSEHARLRCPRRKSSSLALASGAQPQNSSFCISQCALGSSQTMSLLFSERSRGSHTSTPLPRFQPGWPAPLLYLTRVCPALWPSRKVLFLCGLPRQSRPSRCSQKMPHNVLLSPGAGEELIEHTA